MQIAFCEFTFAYRQNYQSHRLVILTKQNSAKRLKYTFIAEFLILIQVFLF